MVIIEDYAPYHTLEAFCRGLSDYKAGQLNNPYILNSVHAQAWDRGTEYAMQTERENQ